MRIARRTLAVTVVAFGLVAHPVPAAADDQPWWHTQWRMDEVWEITDGSGSVVAVIDSGVNADLPELAGAVLPGLDQRDPDGDGRTDHDTELGGHGTGMAVMIAGNAGVRGVAPGASILPVVRARPDSGEAMIAELAEAIRWAVDNGADVINMSFTLSTLHCRAVLLDAVRYALERDVLLVTGSGNTRVDAAWLPGACPGVLTVGATDWRLEPWSDSNRNEAVDLAAPGVEIPVVGRDGATFVTDGTSLSAAAVSGVIALLRAQYPQSSADEVLRRLFATARDVHTPGRDDATGYGLVRPYHALTEQLPEDAPNPVLEALAAVPAPESPLPAAPPPPVAGQPPPAAGADAGVPAWLAGVLAFVAATVVVLALATVMVMRPRRPRAGPE